MAFDKIEPPDSHYLSAATGWLELGNPAEALAELNSISMGCQNNPMVLEIRWMIHAKQEDWALALAAARSTIESAPHLLEGWIHQSYALRRAPGHGLEEAWNALLPVATQFPKEPLVAFNLACYAAQLGQLDKAWQWLKKAAKIGKADSIRKMAAKDPDLQPLWDRLDTL